jgi:hypothetical protein
LTWRGSKVGLGDLLFLADVSGERKCLADVQSAIERLEEEWGFGEARGVGGDELGKRLYSSKDGNIRL